MNHKKYACIWPQRTWHIFDMFFSVCCSEIKHEEHPWIWSHIEMIWLHSLYCMFVTQQAESETWGISMFFYNYENIYAFTLYILWHKQKQEEYPCIWPQGSLSRSNPHFTPEDTTDAAHLSFNSNLILVCIYPCKYILVNISANQPTGGKMQPALFFNSNSPLYICKTTF